MTHMKPWTALTLSLLGAVCWLQFNTANAVSPPVDEPTKAQAGGGFEQGNPGRMGAGREQQGPGRMLEELGLSPEQKEKLKAMMEKNHAQHKAGRQEMKQQRQQLMTMIKSGSGSKQEAMALHRQIAQRQNAMMEQHIGTIYDMKAILTPQQFEKFQTLMAQKHQNRMGGRPHGKGPGMRSQGGGSPGMAK